MAMGFTLGKGGGHGGGGHHGGHGHHGGGGRGRRGYGGWYGYGPDYWEAEPSYIVIQPTCGAGTYVAADGTCKPVPRGLRGLGASTGECQAGYAWDLSDPNNPRCVPQVAPPDPSAAPLMSISMGTAAVVAFGALAIGGAAGALLWKRHRVLGGGLGIAAAAAGLLVANKAGVFVPIM